MINQLTWLFSTLRFPANAACAWLRTGASSTGAAVDGDATMGNELGTLLIFIGRVKDKSRGRGTLSGLMRGCRPSPKS